MTHLSSVVALGGLVFLTACGGGDGGDNPVADHAENSAKVSRIIASTSALAQTSAASMRVTGRVEYDGVVGMAFGGAPASLQTAEMIGDLDLDANFGAGTITGEMDDFNTRDGRELQGELRVTNGTISGSEFSGNAGGTLTGGASAPGRVNATIGGEFTGQGASALAGSGSGTSAGGNVGLIFRGVRDRD